MEVPLGEHLIGRIPVRNLWLLMLYASDLTRIAGALDFIVDEEVNDLPDLIARLLADSVERRLRRNLTRGYHHREMALPRVRGRIDILTTEARQLLSKGEVFCRFEELTNNTPRNKLVRAALELVARVIRSDGLRQKCRALALSLARAGVEGGCPSRSDLAKDRIGRNDSSDRFMVALARLCFDLALPTEESGTMHLAEPDREEVWVRHLFEKAVLGFARVELEPQGWCVRGGVRLEWQVASASEGLRAILPRMVTDILLDPPGGGGRVVIDTKFTSILSIGEFNSPRLKSGYLYQIYAYLRSQEGRDAQWNCAAGLLLHPATDGHIYEHVVIQNHPIAFATVNLCGAAATIRNELREILQGKPLGRTCLQ